MKSRRHELNNIIKPSLNEKKLIGKVASPVKTYKKLPSRSVNKAKFPKKLQDPINFEAKNEANIDYPDLNKTTDVTNQVGKISNKMPKSYVTKHSNSTK